MKPSQILSSTALAGDPPAATLPSGGAGLPAGRQACHADKQDDPGLERRNAAWDTIVFLPGTWDESFRRYLLQAFARQRRGVGRVFCIERPKGPRWPVSRRIDENLWVMSPAVWLHNLIAEYIPGLPFLNQRLLRWQIRRVIGAPQAAGVSVVWLFHPFQAEDAGVWPNDLLIYDCYDRYDEPPEPTTAAWKRKLLAREKTLMAKADLILTVSGPLQKLKTSQGYASERIPNGVDWEFFGKAADAGLAVPGELSRIPSPRLGFIGAMSDRIDFALLDRLAEQQPGNSLVLVGGINGRLQKDKQEALRRLQRRPNVFFLGPQPYERLPNYLKGFDVCLVPYDDTVFNHFSSPLKIYEYLASGKPVVSVSTPEIEAFSDVVSVVADRAAFPQAVEGELQRAADPERRQARMERARENSWDRRSAAIIELIQSRGAALPPAPRKVLHLVTGFEIGDGVVEVVSALASHLNRQKFAPVICALRGTGRYRGIFEQQGIPVFVCDVGSPTGRSQYLRSFQVIRQVRALLEKEPFQVLHAHNFFAGVIGLLASWGRPNLGRVLTMHGYYYFEGWMKTAWRAYLRRLFLRSFFRSWDSVVGVSEAVCRWVAGFGRTSSRVSCIHNGIRGERFAAPADGALYRERWRIPASAKVVGTLGILEKIKGGDCLIEAAARVLLRHPGAYFVFIGARADHEPETLVELQRHAERRGLSGRVIFTDRVLDVANALAALDLFVFSSTHAGFGLAVAEAMYMGKPVVAASIGGIPEIVENEVSGLLVPPQDPVSLSRAIDRLLSDPALAERLGRAGHQRVKKSFLAERMAVDYEALYKDLMTG